MTVNQWSEITAVISAKNKIGGKFKDFIKHAHTSSGNSLIKPDSNNHKSTNAHIDDVEYEKIEYRVNLQTREHNYYQKPCNSL